MRSLPEGSVLLGIVGRGADISREWGGQSEGGLPKKNWVVLELASILRNDRTHSSSKKIVGSRSIRNLSFSWKGPPRSHPGGGNAFSKEEGGL